VSNALAISVRGLDELRKALADAPRELEQTMEAAGEQAARTILETEGLRKYPPLTAANQPPTPYYIRGQGTQYAGGNRNNSERYGTQFYVEASGYSTKVGNRASYAPYLTDEKLQARAMAAKGWRKLLEVAQEQIGEITRIYQAWVDRALERVGLK
jgi:hypothetical protein